MRAASFAGTVRREPLRVGLRSILSWPVRRWVAAGLAAAAAALLTGVPTGVVETGFYTRMTPVIWWDYPVWAISSMLAGLIVATYVRAGNTDLADAPDPAKRTVGGTLLSALAIGCPICNKLVVMALGVGGALTYFQPAQPMLGTLAIAMLGTGLALRLRGAVACPDPAA